MHRSGTRKLRARDSCRFVVPRQGPSDQPLAPAEPRVFVVPRLRTSDQLLAPRSRTFVVPPETGAQQSFCCCSSFEKDRGPAPLGAGPLENAHRAVIDNLCANGRVEVHLPHCCRRHRIHFVRKIARKKSRGENTFFEAPRGIVRPRLQPRVHWAYACDAVSPAITTIYDLRACIAIGGTEFISSGKSRGKNRAGNLGAGHTAPDEDQRLTPYRPRSGSTTPPAAAASRPT